MQERYRAQILLITILVLMIVAIIVVGVIGLASRDVQQSVSEQQYQQILNAAEVQVLDFVNKYGAVDNGLAQLLDDEPQCQILSDLEYECPLGVGDDNVETILRVEDSSTVDDFELVKDDSLELDLVSDPSTGKGFRGEVEFNYTGDVALEFALYYLDGSDEPQVISDVFDVTGGLVFDVQLGNSLDTADSNHPFNFVYDVPSGNYTFLINSIDGFAANFEPVSLRITVRMAPGQTVTLLDVAGNSGSLTLAQAGVFPNQVRIYTALGFFSGEDLNISASINTQVPLLPQAPAFLHSGLLVNSQIAK